MTRRLLGALTLGSLISLFATSVTTTTAAESKDPAKAALQALGEFIGAFKGNAKSSELKTKDWKESLEWGWKIKGDDVALVVTFKDNPLYKTGTLKFLPEKKVYEMTLTNSDDKSLVLTGEFKTKRLTLKGQDATSKEWTEIQMSTNNEGLRFIYSVATAKTEKGIAKKIIEGSHTKEGESIAGGGKKNECIVTGGLGTIGVSFGGKNYFVCCSGCREEFMANPKKYVDEYEKNQKK